MWCGSLRDRKRYHFSSDLLLYFTIELCVHSFMNAVAMAMDDFACASDWVSVYLFEFVIRKFITMMMMLLMIEKKDRRNDWGKKVDFREIERKFYWNDGWRYGGSLSSMQIVNLLSILQFKFKVRSLNHDSQMEYILHADERKRGITFQLWKFVWRFIQMKWQHGFMMRSTRTIFGHALAYNAHI